MKWQVPFFELVLDQKEKHAVLSVLDSNWLTTGPKINEFETLFAEMIGDGKIHAVAVANCTAALHLALASLGIKAGDEVICPSLTFVACANAILYCNATPVFVDIVSADEWNMDPEDIENKITEKTKAIMVVHYAGYPCRMNQILNIADKYNLKIVEDTSHGPLSELEGKTLGTIGDVGCFSFFSNKNITTGEGGMIVTHSHKIAENIKTMRSHGMTHTTYDRFKGHAFGYDVTMLGYNYRMDEIRASIGIEQLKKLAENNMKRKRLVEYYRTIIIRDHKLGVTIPFESWIGGRYSYHIFPILLPEGYTDRNSIMTLMGERGIQTSIHYRPIHTFTAYHDVFAIVPMTDAISQRILSLPLYPSLTMEQIELVVESLKVCLQS